MFVGTITFLPAAFIWIAASIGSTLRPELEITIPVSSGSNPAALESPSDVSDFFQMPFPQELPVRTLAGDRGQGRYRSFD